MKEIHMKEVYIRNQICSWLKWHKAFVFIHDSVGIYDQRIGRFRLRHNIHHVLGVSDLIGIWRKKFLAIEVKGMKGKLTANQQCFLNQVIDAGGIAIVARDILDVETELRRCGEYP